MGAPKQKMDDELLRRLVPLNALSDENFNVLCGKLSVEEIRSGDVVFKAGDKDNRSIYLLSGKLVLVDRHGKKELIESGSEQSRFPVAHHFPRQYSATAKGQVLLVRVESAMLDSLLTADETEIYEVSELHEEEEGDWMTRMLNSKAFEKLSPSNLQALFMHMDEISASSGDVIIHEGDEGDYYYTIKEGQVEITRQLLNKPQPAALAVMGPGEAFGEEALIFGSRRNATVTMKTDGSLMRVNKEHFEKLLKEPLINTVPVSKAISMIEGGAVCIDVRTPQEFQNESLRGSNNIPMNRLRNMLKQMNPDRTYILCCETGNRSSVGAFLMAQRGFDALVMEGGLMNIPSDVFNRLRSSASSSSTEAPKQTDEKGQGAEIVKFSDGKPIEDQAALKAEKEKFRAQAEVEKKKALEEAMRIKAEAEAMKKQAQEELAKLKASTETARKQAEEEAARMREEAEAARKQAEEETKKLKLQREQLISRAKEESEKLKALTEEERKKALAEAESLRAKARAEAEELKIKASKEIEEAKKEADQLKQEQEQARKQAEESAKKLKQEMDELKKKGEEATRLRAEAEQARSNANKEAERLRKEALDEQEKARKEVERLRAEGEETKRSVEEEISQLKVAAETAQKHLEAEKLRLQEEEKAARLHAEAEVAELTAKAEEARIKAEEEENRKAEAESARLKAQEEAVRLRTEAEEARIKIEEESSKLRDEAEHVLRKAEKESAQLLNEAEAARSSIDNVEDSAKKEMEEKANKLLAEAEKMRIAAQEEANKLMGDAEAARIKAQEEAAIIKAEAETARLKAEEEAARLKAEAESAGMQAQEEVNRIKSELEEAKLKARMEQARLKAEHEQARRKAEERAEWLEKEVEQANETGDVDLERALLTGGVIFQDQPKTKTKAKIESEEDIVLSESSSSGSEFSESVSINFTQEETAPAVTSGGNKNIIIAVAVAVIVIAGVVAGYLFSSDEKTPEVASIPEATTKQKSVSKATVPSVKKQDQKIAQQPVTEKPAESITTVRDRLKSGGNGPVMISVPGGSFRMGSPSSSPKFEERPQHEVTLNPFAIGQYEVTIEEYNHFAKANGKSVIKSDNKLPAYRVSWQNAVAYTEWLSRQTGKKYRLPTEAEWEYVARAGNNQPYWWGLTAGENNANCFNCGSQWDHKSPAPVGSFKPNKFGVYDTAGNVLEWTQDCYHRTYDGAPSDGSAWVEDGCSQRIARGGAYDTVSDSIRSAKRNKFAPDVSLDNVGFRVVREM